MAILNSIKATQVMACPGSMALIAEAVLREDGKEVYVCYQSYDTEEYVVAKQSVYHYLAEDGKDPAEITEEHTSLAEAKKSAYGKTFVMLHNLVKKLGEEA